jgi:hypothetical protein
MTEQGSLSKLEYRIENNTVRRSMKAVATRMLFAFVAIGVSLSAPNASADGYRDQFTGYLCKVRFTPVSQQFAYGDSGAVTLDINTQPGCGGSFVGEAAFCTAGATAPACNPDYLWNGWEILAHYNAMVVALANNRQVTILRGQRLQTLDFQLR